MSVRKKKCQVCGEWFRPDPRTVRFQKVCSRSGCRDQRDRRAKKRWWSRNPDYDVSRQNKKRIWAQGNPSYWKTYRARHPDYVERNRQQTQERMRAARIVFANQDAIRKDTVGYLEALRPEGVFANQDTIPKSVDGILTFLVHKERFANQDAIDLAPQRLASSWTPSRPFVSGGMA